MSKTLHSYSVTWEIDACAPTPREAAEIARRAQTRRNTTATVFDVTDASGVITRVDLSEPKPRKTIL